MATLAITLIIGSILNATTFIGGNFLAKKLSGKDQDLEKKRHDLAEEKYQLDYNKWKEKSEKIQEWNEEKKEEEEEDANQKIRDTDQNFKRYYAAHPEEEILKKPNFRNYFKPSSHQKKMK